jgi:pSer/pThr/pTyr-binding forkhead associated (FHA) protein
MRGWILETADDPPITLRLAPGSVKTIGRAPAADFIVDAPLISRVHCRLTAERSDQLVVEDLGSTNGTMVNDQRTDRSVLRTGDRLRVGRVEFTIGRPADAGR